MAVLALLVTVPNAAKAAGAAVQILEPEQLLVLEVMAVSPAAAAAVEAVRQGLAQQVAQAATARRAA